jgi:aminotransferase in exopolysaccharide biosynthesis
MDKIHKLSTDTVSFAREIFGKSFIPLHRPIFEGNERKYLIDCIDSNFVSSVGEKVNQFEEKIAEYTGCKYAIATVNGTSALHIAIKLAGVNPGDEVITQALTFVATCNAITYVGAKPLFIDVDKDTMGLSPNSLRDFLEKNAKKTTNGVFNKHTGNKISACVPMHTFGFPCRIEEISQICHEWGIRLIEDIAESLGSFVGNQHTGNFGEISALSFNGNKVITTGGGGMLITNNENIARQAKHITTTAKLSHPYEFVHDQIGYNYRLPNLNAALGCAQMELLPQFISIKSSLAKKWHKFFNEQDVHFFEAIKPNTANHWLNAIVLKSRDHRDQFLRHTNNQGVMTRPIWTLMSELDMYKDCYTDGLKISSWLQDRVINIPSSVPDGALKKI